MRNEREVRREMDDVLCSRSGALCLWHQALSDEWKAFSSQCKGLWYMLFGLGFMYFVRWVASQVLRVVP